MSCDVNDMAKGSGFIGKHVTNNNSTIDLN